MYSRLITFCIEHSLLLSFYLCGARIHYSFAIESKRSRQRCTLQVEDVPDRPAVVAEKLVLKARSAIFIDTHDFLPNRATFRRSQSDEFPRSRRPVNVSR